MIMIEIENYACDVDSAFIRILISDRDEKNLSKRPEVPGRPGGGCACSPGARCGDAPPLTAV